MTKLLQFYPYWAIEAYFHVNRPAWPIDLTSARLQLKLVELNSPVIRSKAFKSVVINGTSETLAPYYILKQHNK